MIVIETEERHRIRDRIVALARDLILIPSNCQRPEDLRRAFLLVENHLEAVENIQLRTFHHQGCDSLLATPPGIDQPEILLGAHIDVIAHEDPWIYRSQIEHGRIYGPGAGDMKGALAILLELFRRLHHEHPGLPLGLVITSDEETGGENGIGYLFGKAGLRCGEAIIPDGGSLHRVTVEEKGFLHLRLSSRGRSAHAARPWLGHNALETLLSSLARIMEGFDQLKIRQDHWHPTCSLTALNSGSQIVNQIPETASAILDIRFPPPYSIQDIHAMVDACLAHGVTAETIICAAPTTLKPNPEYLEAIQTVTGEPASLIRDHGGSDARFLAAHGIPVQMSRPLVGNLHGVDEWIDIESMVLFYEICERYIRQRLC